MTATTPNKILAAGLLGFLAGILYAPRKGTETQEQIKQKFEDMKSNVIHKTDQAKDKVEEMKSSGQDMVNEVKQQAELDKADKTVGRNMGAGKST